MPLLNGGYHLLDLVQSLRKPTRQAVRYQAERRLSLPAVPPCDPHPRRRYPGVRPVPAKTASTSGMQGALHKSCVPPGLLANVLLAGERRFVAQLHWPGPARRQPWRAISSCLVSRTGDRPVGGAASASFPFPQKIPRFPSQTGSPSQALQRCPTPRSRVRWITKLCATRHSMLRN